MFKSKESISSIVEGLERAREAKSVDEQFEELREPYGLDIWEDYNYEIEDSSFICSVDEAKTITFGGKTFPKFGWSVVMAGGSGLIA